jgi:hypothetical protein
LLLIGLRRFLRLQNFHLDPDCRPSCVALCLLLLPLGGAGLGRLLVRLGEMREKLSSSQLTELHRGSNLVERASIQ